MAIIRNTTRSCSALLLVMLMCLTMPSNSNAQGLVVLKGIRAVGEKIWTKSFVSTSSSVSVSNFLKPGSFVTTSSFINSSPVIAQMQFTSQPLNIVQQLNATPVPSVPDMFDGSLAITAGLVSPEPFPIIVGVGQKRFGNEPFDEDFTSSDQSRNSSFSSGAADFKDYRMRNATGVRTLNLVLTSMKAKVDSALNQMDCSMGQQMALMDLSSSIGAALQRNTELPLSDIQQIYESARESVSLLQGEKFTRLRGVLNSQSRLLEDVIQVMKLWGYKNDTKIRLDIDFPKKPRGRNSQLLRASAH